MGVLARWARRPSLLAAAIVLVPATGVSSGASSSAGAPLVVRSSSLSQHGPYLVWRLRMAQPFSPSALVSAGRSLCLLIERVHGATVAGQACLAGPGRHSRAPRLLYSPVSARGAGGGRKIKASVSRSSTSELTAVFLPDQVRLAYKRVRWQVLSSLTASACAAPAPGGGGRCFNLYPSHGALLALHPPRVVGCRASGPSLVYRGGSRRKELALTFDDGPWDDPPTVQFLEVLERAHVVATFFEIGDQIGTYDRTGAVERRMLRDGDMIGDHTWSHPDMASLPASAQRQELKQAAAAIRHATRGFEPCLWRPPYGDISPSLISLARSLGMLTIMWDVDPQDWTTPGSAVIYQRVVSGAHDGAIIIQHFGGGPRTQTLAALPHEISTLRHEGYRLVTVAALLGLRLIYK